MAKHLTYFADEAGRITNIAAAIEVYAAHHMVSTRVGWTDRKRLMARGWLREQVAPTYGRKALYRLCVDPPTAGDLEEMPRELAHAFARHFGLPIAGPAGEGQGEQHAQPITEIHRVADPVPASDEIPPGSVADITAAAVTKPGAAEDHAGEPAGEHGQHAPPEGNTESHQEPSTPTGRDEDLEIDLGPVPGSLAFLHQHLSDCEVVRLGSATGRCRYSTGGCGRLHTTPFPREAFSPSLRSKPSERHRRRSKGVKISLQERRMAEEVMRRCWHSWCTQRPGMPLTPADWQGLVEVVAHALRAADNVADVCEELTQAVGTARHLPTLLAYRARRIIHRGHCRNAHPTLPPQTIAARQRTAQAMQAGQQATHRAADTLAALRADLATRRRTSVEAAAAPLVTDWATEPDPTTATPFVDAEEIAQRRRHALALHRARQEKTAATRTGAGQDH